MNRRLYHAIRIWLKILVVALVCCAAIAGFIEFVNYIDLTYGKQYGMLAILGSVINTVILFMCAVHVKLFYELDESKVRQYKKSKNPPWHWRLFKWMDRRVFLFLANYFGFIGLLFVCAVAIAAVVLMMDWGVKNYGAKGGIGVLLSVAFAAISCVIAYQKSGEAVKEEQKEQNRIYNSLSRDWDHD